MSLWKIIIIGLLVISVITIANIAGRNMIILLLAFELAFFTLSLACVVYYFLNLGKHWNYDILFTAISLTVVAAAESAVALALIARIYKQTKSIKIKKRG